MSERDWRSRMVDFAAYMRARGWSQPFVFIGQLFAAIGVASPRQLQRTHHNDNRRGRHPS